MRALDDAIFDIDVHRIPARGREDDEPMVKSIIATPALDELVEITEAMDEKTGQDAELQRVH